MDFSPLRISATVHLPNKKKRTSITEVHLSLKNFHHAPQYTFRKFALCHLNRYRQSLFFSLGSHCNKNTVSDLLKYDFPNHVYGTFYNQGNNNKAHQVTPKQTTPFFLSSESNKTLRSPSYYQIQRKKMRISK